MNRLLVILSILMYACSGNVASKEPANTEHHQHQGEVVGKTSKGLSLNNGAKWKSDEPTRKNVAALIKLVNDSTIYNDKSKLAMRLQEGIDTLIKQCRMKGPEHDALHVWLEKVMQDLNNLKQAEKKADQEFKESLVFLKTDLESFHDYFD